ncbi:MAG: PEP-CTERM sorting domain-containing protein [Edaphobacter sp.]
MKNLNSLNSIAKLSVLGILSVSAAAMAHASSICDAATGNLIVNCGFEGGFTTPASGGDVPTGWTVSQWNGDDTINNGGNGVHSGNSALQIGNDVGAGGPLFDGAAILSQSFTDVAGEDYTFSFFLLNTGGGGGIQFQAFWDSTSGTPLLDLVNTNAPTAYTEFSFNVLGTGSDSITFTAVNEPASFFLDDVEVVGQGVTPPPLTATPEPSSLILFGTGLMGAASGAYRRIKQQGKATS